MMPFLKKVSLYSQLPWSSKTADGESFLDGCQAGIDRYGRVMSYDYAFELPERKAWEDELGIISRWQSEWMTQYNCLSQPKVLKE